jgi:hypothetical protein
VKGYLTHNTTFWYLKAVNSKNEKTLKAIFHEPIQAGLLWVDIENLFQALGAEITEGSGSRVRVKLNDVRAVFHRPHPQNTIDKGALRSVRRFLENAGVTR